MNQAVAILAELAALRDAAEAAGKRVLALRERCEDLDVPGGNLDALRAAVARLRAAQQAHAAAEAALRDAHHTRQVILTWWARAGSLITQHR